MSNLEIELEEFKKQKEKILKQYPELFPTEAKFWAYLRGAFRRGLWEKSPLKLKFKNEACTPPPEGYTGRAKSGANCVLTGEWYAKSHLEVDHIEGHIPLNSEEDLIGFLVHMLATSDQLALVSKEAHKIKSYAERMGISFEEAIAAKEAIKICKEGRDRQWLESRGIVAASTKTKRREQIEELLKKG